MTKVKLLITGVSGMLGNNLAIYFREKYDIVGMYCTHPVMIEGVQTLACNLTNEKSVMKAVNDMSPQIIIHCASLTNIEWCEKHHEDTYRVNVEGTGFIVRAAQAIHAKMIYISSDSVYEGNRGNYTESDSVNPQNYYGQSKYEGECEVSPYEKGLILRTNLFGWNIQKKMSLAEWILTQLIHKKTVKGFTDARFSSIYTKNFAFLLTHALRRDLTGVYTCASRTSLSKYEFALKLAQRFGLSQQLIEPISIEDFDFCAKRGKDLSLNMKRFARDADCEIPTIEYSIEKFYQDYIKEDLAKEYGRPLLDNENPFDHDNTSS